MSASGQKKLVWVLVGWAVAATGGLIALLMMQREKVDEDVADTKTRSAENQKGDFRDKPAAAKKQQAAQQMLKQLDRTIAQAPLKKDKELDEYLDELEAQARKKGEVTAWEVEPGMAMIERSGADPRKLGEFSDRMRRLQRELSGERARPNPKETSERLRILLDDIEDTKDAEQQTKIREYLELAEELPAEEARQAMQALDKLKPSQSPSPAPSGAATELLAEVEQAGTEGAKQQLVRKYINHVEQLPAEAALDAMDALARTAVEPSPASDPEAADVLWNAIEKAPDEETEQALIHEYTEYVENLAPEDRERHQRVLNEKYSRHEPSELDPDEHGAPTDVH